MILFDPAHRAVHYPPDRRFRFWIRPSIPIGIGIAIPLCNRGVWIEVAVAGLPHVPPVPQIYPDNFAGPHGFPVCGRYCHFFNFLFVMMLIRSGLSILVDHPRLYFNDGCTPGSEWIPVTPLKVPEDRIWTAKDDARYISPLIGTPGRFDTPLVLHGFGTSSTFTASSSLAFCSLLCSSIPSSGGVSCQLRRSSSCRHGTRGCTTRRFTCLQNRTGFMATTHYSRLPISASSFSSARWRFLRGSPCRLPW